MIWTYDELFPERADQFEARMDNPLTTPTVIFGDRIPYEEVRVTVRRRSEWKLIDQGVQPRRVIRLEE